MGKLLILCLTRWIFKVSELNLDCFEFASDFFRLRIFLKSLYIDTFVFLLGLRF